VLLPDGVVIDTEQGVPRWQHFADVVERGGRKCTPLLLSSDGSAIV
jgi:hypothetical protein